MKWLTVLLVILTYSVVCAQKAIVRSAEEGTDISVISYEKPNKWALAIVDTTVIGKDTGIVKAIYDYMLLLSQKKGHKNKVQLVHRYALLKSRRGLTLDPLFSFKAVADSNRALFIDKVAFNVKAADYTRKTYESIEDYQKGRVDYSKKQTTELMFDNTIFYDLLNDFLEENGVLYNGSKLNKSGTGVLRIEFDVESITEHVFANYAAVELVTKTKIYDIWGSVVLHEQTYTAKSDVGFDIPNSNYQKNIFNDALQNLLCEIIVDEKIKEKFSHTEKRMMEISAAWSPIEIVNKTTNDFSLEDAAAAVVTIKQGKGHGSGCIISQSGYIITNHHVIDKADSNDIFVIFNEGGSVPCKVIRSNPFYDLALLKIDTLTPTVLKVNSNKAIKLGAEVYAIGTPSDINLGQSITKGIISGKRTIENKTFIQSDVSINKGNSGGAMTNKEGELIGIVSAKLIGVGIEGVGFAIPSYYLEEALKIKLSAE